MFHTVDSVEKTIDSDIFMVQRQLLAEASLDSSISPTHIYVNGSDDEF